MAECSPRIDKLVKDLIHTLLESVEWIVSSPVVHRHVAWCCVVVERGRTFCWCCLVKIKTKDKVLLEGGLGCHFIRSSKS